MNVFQWRDAPVADFAVVGDPVSHSLSPTMHQAAFEACGLTYRYVAVHVPRGELAEALDRLQNFGYRGVNVTIPHKEAALRWCSVQDPDAQKLKAANTVRMQDLSCINTDLTGFWDTLAGQPLPSRRAMVLGAGGSARAVILALSRQGFEIGIWNRTRANVQQVLEELELEAVVLDTPSWSDAALIVNTTSASLQGESLPVAWSSLLPGGLAYDLMYRREDTPFLLDAKAHGHRAWDGRRLLAAQGARSFEYWLGIEAPWSVMLKAING